MKRVLGTVSLGVKATALNHLRNIHDYIIPSLVSLILDVEASAFESIGRALLRNLPFDSAFNVPKTICKV